MAARTWLVNEREYIYTAALLSSRVHVPIEKGNSASDSVIVGFCGPAVEEIRANEISLVAVRVQLLVSRRGSRSHDNGDHGKCPRSMSYFS